MARGGFQGCGVRGVGGGAAAGAGGAAWVALETGSLYVRFVEVSKSRVFCPACGLQVEPALGIEGDHRTISCSLCDLLLESRPANDAAPSAPAVMTAPAAPAQFGTALQTVIAAEDTEGILRELVKLLGERGIARTVLPAKNGEECLIQYHRAVAAGQIPQLAILDVQMPILNGINAAIAIRAAERAAGIQTPTAILFFTATTCDDSFKRVLQFTAPARYLNKGAPGTAAEFAERLVQVLLRLMQPGATAPA